MLVELKNLRMESSITQKQLAEAVGVSQQSINKYENHSVEPDIETMIKIADFFYVSVDHLIGRSSIILKEEYAESLVLDKLEQRMIMGYRKLPERKKKTVIEIIELFNE